MVWKASAYFSRNSLLLYLLLGYPLYNILTKYSYIETFAPSLSVAFKFQKSEKNWLKNDMPKIKERRHTSAFSSIPTMKHGQLSIAHAWLTCDMLWL